MAKNIKVTKESESGLNQKFHVTSQGEVNRGDLNLQITQGKHPYYHIMHHQSGAKVPRSNPDKSKRNNLG